MKMKIVKVKMNLMMLYVLDVVEKDIMQIHVMLQNIVEDIIYKINTVGVLLCRLISPYFLYLSTQRIKLRAEHLNILQTSSCHLYSVK
jgi:hypothetical protein